MKFVKSPIILLCAVSILTSCNNQRVESNLPKSELGSQSSSESLPVANSGSFSYGDELAFYENDEKSNKNPTAISVVNKFLASTKTNDYDAWLSTLTTERQKGFSREANGEFGVISLDILDVHYEADTIYKHNILKSGKAVENGWTADNVAVIYALYEAKYDGKKVPADSGKIEWHFSLVRKDKNSP
jgi:hypothetical protein